MKNETIVDYVVKIPNDEGTKFIDQVTVQIPVEIDEFTGEEILGQKAQQIIDETRARLMGLLSPTELKTLRESLRLTQKEMAQKIGAGEKSYTRWENGHGRQSRLVNNLLLLLKNGTITLTHLSPHYTSVAFQWTRLHLATNAWIASSPSVYATHVARDSQDSLKVPPAPDSVVNRVSSYRESQSRPAVYKVDPNSIYEAVAA